MDIWVDADACPKMIKELLYKVAKRTGVSVTLVANQYLFIPPHPAIKFIQVDMGMDVADKKIVDLCAKGDLVVTADIPLASASVKKGAYALNPRGKLYDEGNIGDALAMRDLMESLRGGAMGEHTGGPDTFAARDCESFANTLDKFMAKNL